MSIRVYPLPDQEALRKDYDNALVAVGYESRARHFIAHFQGSVPSKVALMFSEHRVIEFENNRKTFENQQFVLKSAAISEVELWAKDVVGTSTKDSRRSIRVLVDISSMTRQQIAAIVFFLWNCSRNVSDTLLVDFVYSVAEFGDIPGAYGPIVFDGPSIPQLAGWSSKAKLACGVILGIGYEEDLALGVIEELEAANVWAFQPTGHDGRYDKAIRANNRGLFEEIPSRNLISYSVFDPYSTFVAIETLAGLAKRGCRLIVVPFGPKIFALTSCLATMCHYPEVGFWRVSGGANQQPVDRKPLGPILGLTAEFSPNTD